MTARPTPQLAPINKDATRGGICYGMDPVEVEAIFFPREESQPAAKKALRICQHCPIIRACAEHAIEHEAYGIWAGLTSNKRKTIRARRRKAERAEVAS